MVAKPDLPNRGLPYRDQIVGKYLYRVRERYVADYVVRLVRGNAAGAAKLDLVLRGLALSPAHAGKREPGFITRNISYEDLHDLCRSPHHFDTTRPEDVRDDSAITDLKREWVRAKLARLEQEKLIRREARPGDRPDIYVLRDTGTGEPFDDPGAVASQPGNSYITVHGGVVSDRRFRDWGGAELAAYLCAMTAERFDKNPPARSGTGTWFRTIDWFSGKRRNEGHVTYSFGQRNLRAGLRSLVRQGFIDTRESRIHRGKRLKRSRRIYTNRFDAAQGQVIDLTAFLGDDATTSSG